MKKSMFSIFEEIEKNKDVINDKIKKSMFNIFFKTAGNKKIIFNSFSLAIALVDENFFKLYDNIEKINFNNLNGKDKISYNTMLSCNFIVKSVIDEIDKLKNFIYQRISNNNVLNLSFFPSYINNKIKKNIISNNILKKILKLINNCAEKKMPVLIRWFYRDPLKDHIIFHDFSQKVINICKEKNVKYFPEIIIDGRLLTEDFIDKLKDSNITLLHTAIDLSSENFDKSIYKIILEKIIKLKKNNINVSIKINVKKDFTIDSLLKIIKILEENDLKNRYYFNAAEFDSDSNMDLYSGNKNCFTNIGYAKFCIEFYKKLQESNINYPDNKFYPDINRLNFCDITKCRSLTIDPDGNLYKCPIEADISEKKIGNILDRENLNDFFISNDNDYITWQPFMFTECNTCSLIPICYGNCPKIKINQKNEYRCNEKKNIVNSLIEAIALEKIKAKK